MTKTMAEVLAEHLPIYKFSHTLGERAWACSTPRCEVEGEFSAVIDHQAAALSAAGFGLVADAGAKALEDAADAAFKDKGIQGLRRVLIGNWLRNRAAAVRPTNAHD